MRTTRSLLLFAAVTSLYGADLALAQETKAPEAEPRLLNPLSAIPRSSLSGFSDRPLFSASRRKVETVVPDISDVDAAPPEALNLQLLGIVVTPQGAVARVLDLNDDARYSLRETESFHDWRVKSISPSGLVLDKDDETQSFSVFKTPDDPSPVPP